MEQIYGGTVGSASAPFAWIGVFAFVIGVCALAAGGYEAGKKIRKAKKEDARDVPYNNSDKDDERKKKQKQQLEWQMEHLRLEWKEKELRCQNVREQCGDVKESDAGKRLREQREALVMQKRFLCGLQRKRLM